MPQLRLTDPAADAVAAGNAPRRSFARLLAAVAAPGAGASRVVAEVLALVVPPRCLACGEPLAAAAAGLCGGCRAGLPWLQGRRCGRCGLPASCAPCPAAGAAFAAAWAPVAHAGPARALVAALKFRGALAVADLMAAQIAAGAPAGLLAGAALVPVASHPARRRARGFDPAEQLARALSRRTGRPLVRCLGRRGAAVRQFGAPRSVRRRAGRLDVTVRGRVPAHAVLVDDVHTTGATLDACARALRAAGARKVVAVTYARAL